MLILNDKIDLEDFWKMLAVSSVSVLFLDYDGTIAPFRVERDKAIPYPWIPDMLNSILKEGHTKIVVISGRNISDVQKLLNLCKPFEIWGAHGREHITSNGIIESVPIPESAKKVMSEACKWVECHGYSDHLEKKRGCLALHFRGMGKKEAWTIENQVVDAFGAMLPGSGMELKSFDGGIELCTSGVNKGQSIKKVLDQYDQEVISAYLGDDFTDEDAFSAIKGRGLGVLVREELRFTEADIWIKPPEELKIFLSRWNETIRREKS